MGQDLLKQLEQLDTVNLTSQMELLKRFAIYSQTHGST